MTELKIKIKNDKAEPEVKSGLYLATFFKKDDRILVYNLDILEDVLSIMGSPPKLIVQRKPHEGNYTDIRKIKKMTIEVELE